MLFTAKIAYFFGVPLSGEAHQQDVARVLHAVPDEDDEPEGQGVEEAGVFHRWSSSSAVTDGDCGVAVGGCWSSGAGGRLLGRRHHTVAGRRHHFVLGAGHSSCRWCCGWLAGWLLLLVAVCFLPSLYYVLREEDFQVRMLKFWYMDFSIWLGQILTHSHRKQ